MARLDGWFLAECEIDQDGAELVICSPASTDDPAASMTLSSLTAIVQLRDLIDEAVAIAEQRAEMLRDSNVQLRLTPDTDSGIISTSGGA